MKYTTQIDIQLPREQVIALFDNPDNMQHWQPGFISMEHVSGKPGQEGAKSRLIYQMGKRRIEMIETITERNLPDVFHGTYDADGVHNKVFNYFKEKDNGTTSWISENVFELKGFMKLMGWLMPGMFKKQSYLYMKNFKAFAEEGKSVKHA